MAEYDGEIKLGVSLEAADVKRSASQLSTEISKIFKASAGKEVDAKFQSLQASMSKSVSKAQQLTQELYQLEQTKVPTAQYSALQQQIDRTEQALEKLGNESIKLQKSGDQSLKVAQRIKEIEIEAEKLQTRYADVADRMYDMEQAGTAFSSGSQSEKYAQLSGRLADVNNQMRVQITKADQLNAAENKQASTTAKLTKQKEKLANATKKVKNAAKDAAKSQKSLGQSMSGVSLNADKLVKSFIKWGLGIRSLFVAYRKLRQAIGEAWETMAQLNDGNNAVNKSISEFTSSLTYLKNSIGAAFAPILTVVAPILSQLITMLAVATNQVGMFIAALTGQKTFTKAVKVYKDYAKSIKDGTKAKKDDNKETNKSLASYDKLNNVTTKKDKEQDTGAGQPGVNDMFKTVPVDNKVLDWLDDIKKKLQPLIDRAKELADIFMNGFNDTADFLNLDDQVQDVIDTLGKIKQHLSDIFNDPEVQAHLQAFLDKVAYATGQITASLASMVLTIIQNILGGIEKYLDQNKERIKQYLISMFDIWGEIAEQLGNFFVAFADIFQAFASEEGKQLTANIIGIFADTFMGITELASKFVRDVLILITQPIIDNEKQIKEVLTQFLGFLAEITGTIKDMIDETFDNLNKMYDEHIKPLFESLTQGLSAIVKTILDNWQQYVQPVLDNIAKKFDELIKQHVQPLINETITFIGNIADVIKLLWENVIQPFITWIINTVVPAVTPVINAIVTLLFNFFGHVADIFKNIVKMLNGVIEFLVGVFTGDWDKAWEGVKKIFEGWVSAWKSIWEGLRDFFKDVFLTIQRFIEEKLNLIGNAIQGANDLIVGIVEGCMKAASDAVESAVDKFRDPINDILGFFEGLANGVVDAVNTVIEALNGMEIDVPDWVTDKFGIDDFSFNIPTFSNISIPRLAQGAVIPPNAPFMAMLGDQKSGTNIEAPLSTIQEALYNALVQAGLTNREQQSNNNQDIVVQIDGREIARAVRREDNIFKKSTGQSMFAY